MFILKRNLLFGYVVLKSIDKIHEGISYVSLPFTAQLQAALNLCFRF